MSTGLSLKTASGWCTFSVPLNRSRAPFAVRARVSSRVPARPPAPRAPDFPQAVQPPGEYPNLAFLLSKIAALSPKWEAWISRVRQPPGRQAAAGMGKIRAGVQAILAGLGAACGGQPPLFSRREIAAALPDACRKSGCGRAPPAATVFQTENRSHPPTLAEKPDAGGNALLPLFSKREIATTLPMLAESPDADGSALPLLSDRRKTAATLPTLAENPDAGGSILPPPFSSRKTAATPPTLAEKPRMQAGLVRIPKFLLPPA